MDVYDRIFTLTAFILQIVLLAYFIFRKLNFEATVRWGWIVYALAVPALIVSAMLLRAGKPWTFWIGGLLFTVWAILGFIVDIGRPVAWRSPPFLPVFIPYVLMYMAAQMFYWFPVGTLQRSLWYFYAVVFILSTYFNLTSHQS